MFLVRVIAVDLKKDRTRKTFLLNQDAIYGELGFYGYDILQDLGMDVSDPFILVFSRSTSVPTVASSTFYSLMHLLLSIQVATTPICLYKVWTFKDIQRQEGPRYDIERFGILEAFGSLRQCDLIVVQGTVTRKMAPRLNMVYDQMPEPKYVIAMGACVITGGLHIDSYNVLPGIDGIIQVDVYVPGCPPRPRH
jgi:hypothetical protein